MVGYTLLFGTILFFGLTRTQVGRDGLRAQIERSFENRFDGTLEIGSLRGDLVSRLFGDDVTVFDADGTTVMKIDRLTLSPSWSELFRRRLKFSFLHADGIHVTATADPSGSWDVLRVFRSQNEKKDQAPFAFSIADVELDNIEVLTKADSSVSRLIDNGKLFDFANADMRSSNIHAGIGWSATSQIIDIYHFDGYVDGTGITIDNIRGQLVLDDEQLSVNELFIRSGDMIVNVAGYLQSAEPTDASAPGSATVSLSPTVSLSIDLQDIDNDRIVEIAPKWILSNTFSFSSAVEGSLSALDLKQTTLTSGQSSIAFSGKVLGLPDSIFAQGMLDIPFLLSQDIQAVAPTIDVSSYSKVDSLILSSPVQARLSFPGPFVPSRFDDIRLKELRLDELSLDNIISQSIAGFVGGSLSYRSGQTDELSGSVDIRRLDPAIILADERFESNINGQVEFRSNILSDNTLNIEVLADLSSSTIAGYSIDSSIVNGVYSNGLFAGDFRLRQGTGTLVGGISLDQAPDTPTFELDVILANLDASTVSPKFERLVDLNGRVQLSGRGLSLDEIDARLILTSDSSSIRSSNGQVRILDTDETSFSLTSVPNKTTLLANGDLVQGNLTIDNNLQAVKDGAVHWGKVLADRGAELARYRTESASSRPSLRSYTTSVFEHETSVDGSFQFADAMLFQGLVSSTSIEGRSIVVDVEATGSNESLAGRIEILADTLNVSSVRTDSLHASLSLSARVQSDSTSEVNFALTASGAHGSLLRQRLASPNLTLAMNDRDGSVTFNSTNSDGVTPLDISGRINNDASGSFIVFDRLSIKSSTYNLGLNSERKLRVFRDAIVVDYLELKRQDASTEEEFVRLDGVLSRAPTDTLSLESANLSLGDISRVFSFRRPIGGQLDSDLHLTLGEATPIALGDILINNFSIGKRSLGDLRAASAFSSGPGEIALDVVISPSSSAPPLGITATNNSIRIDGTLNVGKDSADEQLNLRANIDRADLFFFESIFASTIADVTGYMTGSSTIKGSFKKPVFDANLEVIDGDFYVPKFNLHYAIDGSVTVDERGIRLSQARIVDDLEGTANLTGSVLFNNYSFFSLDLAGTLSSFEIMNIDDSDTLPFFGHIQASGDARLTGPISGALLESDNAITTANSELYIPLVEAGATSDASFIVFTDSTGAIPDLTKRNQRRNVLARRPVGERTFIDGLDMDLNIRGPEGSTVHLVIDPLVGDVINAVGNARIQIQRFGGEFATYGSFLVTGGDYLFTAGEVFVRKFDLDQGGVITWDGNPTNALLNIPASYRTRASRAGLPSSGQDLNQSLIPLVVRLGITGRVSAPEVNLSLEVDRSDRNLSTSYASIETILNQPDRATEYATSVLLTNSFLLTTQGTNSEALTSSAFNSLSQLVASQLNRYINEALPNIDFSFGVQGESTQELDVTYGIALRLLDERLVIRGQGVYQGARSTVDTGQQSLQGEFVVEVRLNPSVSVEVFYRREGDVLAEESFLTNTTGAGLSYQTEFATWRRFFKKLFGRDIPEQSTPPDANGSDIIDTGGGDTVPLQ